MEPPASATNFFIRSILVVFAMFCIQQKSFCAVYPEHQVKAAFLFNFGKFVEWPKISAQSVSPHVSICVMGADPIREALESLFKDRKLKGKEVVLMQVRGSRSLQDCNILYVSASMSGGVQNAIRSVGSHPILTVSDAPRFAEEGGIIQLFQEGKSIHFSINLSAAKSVGLTISSQLLSLAKEVR